MGFIVGRLHVAFSPEKCNYCGGENLRSEDSFFCSDKCMAEYMDNGNMPAPKTEEIELPLYEGC